MISFEARISVIGVSIPHDAPDQHHAWDPDKNERLKAGRGISFEEIVAAVEEDGLKDVLVHPNQPRYPRQVVLVVAYRSYIFLVPSVEEETHCRKATRDYLGTGDTDEEA